MKRLILAPLPFLAACYCPDHDPIDASFYALVRGIADDMGAQCAQLCTEERWPVRSIESCRIELADAGVAAVSCTFKPGCIGGRRPHEVVRVDARARDVVGAWLAEAAQLEAASVPAFEILADELRAHDAPPALIAAALASADDERRHAAIMSSLARRFGARPGPVRVPRRAPRDLESIARENAVEGLVREAFGARVAIEPAIGADEERHAALAAAVHQWVRPRLAVAARRRVDEARDLARAQLIADAAVEPPRALRDVLGLPDATRAVALARAI